MQYLYELIHRNVAAWHDEAIRELGPGRLREGQRILEELSVENLTTGGALR